MRLSGASIIVRNYTSAGWIPGDASRSHHYCRTLESGSILVFEDLPFSFPAEHREFLLSQRQIGSRFHKNISYRPLRDSMRGVSSGSPDRERLHGILRAYSRNVTAFVTSFLAPYAGRFQLDFASFRPLREEARHLPLHKRNDLLHVDAFPTRPTRGGRILRVFTNIHPSAKRIWSTGEPFHVMAPKFATALGLQHVSLGRAVIHGFERLAHRAGLPVPLRFAYDRFMLRFHDWLKEDQAFQQHSPKIRTGFPPGCTWLVFTDGVPHAALSGQYALEQTFIVPQQALVAPEVSPLRVLERIFGTRLDN